MKQTQSELFSALKQTDSSLNLTDYYLDSLVLVGLTKSGKSTLFNWLLEQQLIGIPSAQTTIYELVSHPGKAQIGSDISPTTTIPNVAKMSSLYSPLLIDTCSYLTKLDETSTDIRNYSFEKILTRARNVRFMVVIRQQWLRGTGAMVVDSFRGFLEQLNLVGLEEGVMGRVVQAMAVAITGVTDDKKYIICLQQIVDKLRYSSENIKFKQTICHILDSIIKTKRILTFEQAKKDKIATAFNFSKNLEPMLQDSKYEWRSVTIDQQKIKNHPRSMINEVSMQMYEKLGREEKDAEEKMEWKNLKKKVKEESMILEGVMGRSFRKEEGEDGGEKKQESMILSGLYIAESKRKQEIMKKSRRNPSQILQQQEDQQQFQFADIPSYLHHKSNLQQKLHEYELYKSKSSAS